MLVIFPIYINFGIAKIESGDHKNQNRWSILSGDLHFQHAHTHTHSHAPIRWLQKLSRALVNLFHCSKCNIVAISISIYFFYEIIYNAKDSRFIESYSFAVGVSSVISDRSPGEYTNVKGRKTFIFFFVFFFSSKPEYNYMLLFGVFSRQNDRISAKRRIRNNFFKTQRTFWQKNDLWNCVRLWLVRSERERERRVIPYTSILYIFFIMVYL